MSDALEFANIKHFRWTCIQVTSIPSYTEVKDNSSTGKVINISVGRESVGSFSVRCFLGSADGSVFMSDAQDVVNCCPGNKPWVLVRFALNPNEGQIDGYDR